MKNLKIVLASLLLTVALVGLSSFAAKSYNKKAFATTCYSYGGIQPPTTTSIGSTSSWTSVADPNGCDAGAHNLCVICFDNTQYTTLQAALNRAKIDYPTIPITNNGPITINGITYYFKS